MPAKLYLSGNVSFYNVSKYQQSAKEHLKSTKRRYYRIKSKHRKDIISSALKMAYEKTTSETIGFFTLTFPNLSNLLECEYKGQYNPYYNDQISSFLDYLTDKGLSINKHKVKCTGYIWTKELTNNLAIHYHVIIRFAGKIVKGTIKKLNELWGNYTGFHSPNGLRVGKKGLILNSPIISAKYASKYASKSQKGIEKFPSPAHRISNSLKIDPKNFIDQENDKIDELFYSLEWKFETEWAIVGQINQEFAKKIYNSIDL